MQSWVVRFRESTRYQWHLFNALQPTLPEVLTGVFLFQLAGLAVIAFGLWLRFGGVIADIASDKRSPEYFFMGKLKCLWWQDFSIGFILGHVTYLIHWIIWRQTIPVLNYTKLDILVLCVMCMMVFILSLLGINFLRPKWTLLSDLIQPSRILSELC